ncbi:hypothetical protein OQJ19_09120 [Fluoribacter gormanii]|uniref:Methyltransferase domain n=1 Tax=Fluoribacter gormanii TaxID=464 RepID=A0A377GN67_9GAMM|nr:hypothetical protein [Fluoribacter gormanii]KTD05237.1 hypothetical protein Lgor_0560 [Fluoribacter gormanii]MCW8445561.1 hypothetical protein [Fluoribacter gormanii]MCW8470811.1 hypothetical protein [Fluoribacter gormanii]SIR00683.1 hypothetical protein SAMN05421777_10593 [Fluoribacter gormanii]STO26064.1 Uncharacterised protein [Fluoribacter gormanii]
MKSKLEWKDRPQEIKSKITEAWDNLANHPNDLWVYSGSSHYYLCGVDEFLLIKNIIKNNPERKEFYLLDIGAGDFSLSSYLTEQINDSQEIPKDIEINIIGIRGENYEGPELEKIGICNLYKFGRFQIENLTDEFKLRNLPLTQKVDVILSRWTFIHLVDGVGTLLQAYNLLKPFTGILLADGCYYLRNNKNPSDYVPEDMWHLLIELEVPFLIRPYDLGGSLDQFLIRRKDDRECELPYRYTNIQPISKSSQSYSGYVVSFETPRDIILDDSNMKRCQLSGDKELYGYIFDALDTNPRFRLKYTGEILKLDYKEQKDLFIKSERQEITSEITTTNNYSPLLFKTKSGSNKDTGMIKNPDLHPNSSVEITF